jgi:hypothetical protein
VSITPGTKPKSPKTPKWGCTSSIHRLKWARETTLCRLRAFHATRCNQTLRDALAPYATICQANRGVRLGTVSTSRRVLILIRALYPRLTPCPSNNEALLAQGLPRHPLAHLQQGRPTPRYAGAGRHCTASPSEASGRTVCARGRCFEVHEPSKKDWYSASPF